MAITVGTLTIPTTGTDPKVANKVTAEDAIEALLQNSVGQINDRFDALEFAALVGYPLYNTVLEALADTVDGDTFSVTSSTTFDMYRNDAGTAVLVASLPLASTITPSFTSRASAQDFAGASSDGATFTINGLHFKVSSGSTAVPGVNDCVPLAPFSIEHFLDNTVPGTTPMAAALVAAEAYVQSLAQDCEVPVSLGGKTCALESQVFFSESVGVVFQNGRILATGLAAAYTSLDTFPVQKWRPEFDGLDRPGPMISVTNSNKVRFKNVTFDCNKVSSGVRWRNNEYGGMTECFVDNIAHLGYGVLTRDVNLEVKFNHVIISQFGFSDSDRGDQDKRTAIAWDMNSPDVFMSQCTGYFCGIPFYKSGFGSFHLTDFHPYNSFLETNVEADKILNAYIENPSNLIVTGGYWDKGKIYLNADELHSANAGGAKTIQFANNWSPFSSADADNDADLEIHTSVASNDLAGLSISNWRFSARATNVQMTTSGSGSYLNDRFLKWTISNVAQSNGQPVSGLGEENTIWSQGAYAKIVTNQGDGSARTWLATRDLHLGASGTSEVEFSAPNSINIHADPEDNSGTDGFVGFSVGDFIAGKALRTGWELNGLTKIANLQITTAGTSSSQLNAALRVVGSLQNRAFSTRDEIVTAIAAGDKAPDGYVVFADGIAWEYQSALAGGGAVISDMPGMKPWFSVTPNHWKRNATPGTTDMASAVQSAFNYVFGTLGTDGAIGREPFRVVDFKAESYYFGSTVKWTGTEDYFWARGNGARLTTDLDIALIQVGADVLFSGGDTAGEVNNYSGVISGFVFNHTDGTSVASVAIRAGLNSGMIVKENVFVDFWVAIDGHRYIGRTISDNYFMLSNLRTVQAEAFIRLQGVYNSTNGYTPGGGIHCHGNEFWGRADDPSKIRAHILIHAVDGFYHASNHYIAYEEAAIKIEPQGSTGNSRNNVIIDVISGGENYFDNPPSGARSVWLGGTVAYAGTSGQANGQYKNISFSSGDYFRGAGVARNGIFIAVTDGGGFVTARGGLHGISVNDCRFEEWSNVPIEVQGGPDSKIECVDLSITGSKFRNNNHGSLVNAGILAVVNSCIIMGNSFGEEANAPERCVSVGLDSADDGYSAIVLGNNFSNSLYTVEPYFVTTNADTVVTLGPNLTRDGTLNENNEIYASRADAEASKIPTSRVVIEVRKPDGGTLRYKRNPGGAASHLIAMTTVGGATWSPDHVNTPNHWAEHTTPGTTDMGPAINAAILYANAIGGGTVFCPPSTYRHLVPLAALNNVTVSCRGCTFIKEGGTQLPEKASWLFGTYRPDTYDDLDWKAANSVTVGQVSITTTTPADAGALAAGDIVFIRNSANYLKASQTKYTWLQINKVVSVNVTTGVVTLESAIDSTQTGVLVAKASATSVRVLNDDLTDSPYFAYTIENFQLLGGIWRNGGRLIDGGGAYKCVFAPDEVIAKTGVANGNFFASCRFSVMHEKVWNKSVELAMNSHDNFVKINLITYDRQAGSEDRPLLSTTESARNNKIEIAKVNAGSGYDWPLSYLVDVETTSENIFEIGEVIAPAFQGSFVGFYSTAETPSQPNTLRNTVTIGRGVAGAARCYVSFDATGGSGTNDGNRLVGSRFEGAVTNAVELIGSTSVNISGSSFALGKIAVTGTPSGVISNSYFAAEPVVSAQTAPGIAFSNIETAFSRRGHSVDHTIANQVITLAASPFTLTKTVPANTLGTNQSLGQILVSLRGSASGTAGEKKVSVTIIGDSTVKIAEIVFAAGDVGGFEMEIAMNSSGNTTILYNGRRSYITNSTIVSGSVTKTSLSSGTFDIKLDASVADDADNIIIRQGSIKYRDILQ
jgi:hypothetical protein